jgi:hypothetical protein
MSSLLAFNFQQGEQLMPTYTIEPLNEPRGEGGGWEPCDEQDATCFAVICVESNEVMDAPDTRAQAEAFIKESV